MANAFDIMKLTPSGNVAKDATMVFTYPSGNASRYQQSGEKLVIRGLQNSLDQAADTFALSYGSTTVTVTYKGNTTIPAGTEVLLQAPLAKYDDTAIVALTDSSGGTASNTLADVPASYTEATLANQIASLAAKVNALIARTNTLVELSVKKDEWPNVG